MGEITIRYFAVFRETLGVSEESVSLDDLSTPSVHGVWEYVVAASEKFRDRERFVRFAVNREFADLDTKLEPGDEVALIPPVSGGSDAMFAVTSSELDVARVVNLVRRPESGAVVTFEGVVRDHTGDRDVEYLEYEVYEEMALEKLREVADRISKNFEDVRIAIHHRFGRLQIGDCAVVIAVSSPHRADAYAASQQTIDALKEEVPIWKKEVSPDGDEWVGWGP